MDRLMVDMCCNVMAWAGQWSAFQWLQVSWSFAMFALVLSAIMIVVYQRDIDQQAKMLERKETEFDDAEWGWRIKVEDMWKRNSRLKNEIRFLNATIEQWKDCSKVNQENFEDMRNCYIQCSNVLNELDSELYVISRRGKCGRWDGKATISELMNKYSTGKMRD